MTILGLPRNQHLKKKMFFLCYSWTKEPEILLSLSQPHFEASVRMKLTLPKVRTWSPLELPKIQSLISGVKKPRIEVFFMPLERSWSVDVQNAFAWVIWTFETQVMVKKRDGSQIVSLTPDH
jgi:hypothetical protein